MRVLFVSSAVPFPANNGIGMRTFAVLKVLAELGHDIQMVAIGRSDEADNKQAKQICRQVWVVPHFVNNQSASTGHAARLRGLASRLPYGILRYRVPAMHDTITRILATDDIDLVICGGIGMMVNLPASQTPVLLDCADIEHLILERYLSRERNPAKFLYAWLEYRKMRAWERRAYENAAAVLFCSEVDKLIAQQMCPTAAIHVVPNVVDTEFYKPVAPRDGATLLYAGGMDWYPNRDAVEFFAFSILPRIRQRLAQVKFVIAGRNPTPEFLRKFETISGIEFTGTVPDMRPYVSEATICVVPLRIGSGTRLKILEAAAMGKAIVSTRLGAEGLDFKDSSEIALADTPQAFADEVVQLLRNARRRQSMGAAARRRVEQDYSFAVLKRRMEQVLENAFACSRVGDCCTRAHFLAVNDRSTLPSQPITICGGTVWGRDSAQPSRLSDPTSQ